MNQLVNSLTGERLFGIALDGRIEPRLVERWLISDDGLRWDLSLRSGLRFHDGSPVTADSVRQILEGEIAGQNVTPGFLDIIEILPLDERTLRVRLSHASSFLLEDLAGYSLTKISLNGGSIGIGPFVPVTTTPESVELRAFKEFHAGEPAISGVHLRSYPTLRAAWAALLRDEIDSLYEVGRQALDFVEAESSVQVFSFSRPFVHTLGFNVTSGVLADPEVRRAINMAINRQAIVETVLRGRGRIAEGYVWPGHWAYDRTAPIFTYDPQAAQVLLDAAGFPRKDRPGLEPARFTIRCIVPENVSFFEPMALVLQKDLYQVGIDLVLKPIPAAEFGKRLGSGDFESFLFELASPRLLSWAYRFLHSPRERIPLLNWGYGTADDALDEVRQARTDEEIRVGVGKLQRALHDDPPAAFISWDERARAVSLRFRVPDQPGLDVMNLLPQWKPARDLPE